MGERNLHWEDGEIVELLHQVTEIPQKFWEEGERHILANKETPQDIKADLLDILEVTNFVYENKFPLAVERFKKLTEDQKGLLTSLIDWASGDCPCPYCTAERAVRAEMQEEIISRRNEETLREERATHFRKMEEISRSKSYEISEDVFEKYTDYKAQLFAMIAKLESAVELLDEDDPRSEFASQVLNNYYESMY